MSAEVILVLAVLAFVGALFAARIGLLAEYLIGIGIAGVIFAAMHFLDDYLRSIL